MNCFYKVGKLFFSIAGDNPYGEELKAYFADSAIKDDIQDDCMLNIYVAGHNDVLNFDVDRYAVSDSISFNYNSFRIIRNRYIYIVKNLFKKGAPTEVWLQPCRNKSFFDNMCSAFPFQLFFNHHNKYKRFVQEVTNYSCLWYIFAVTLMKTNSVFIHSSMVGKSDEGIVLTGAGGCGKTSTMVDLISSYGWKFMSEDFGILSDDGVMYYMQKKASIYGSDVKWGNRRLTTAWDNLNFIKKAEWNVKKALGKDPVYQFTPTELFGKDIIIDSPVKKVVFLSRGKNSSINKKDISGEEMAKRVELASIRECKELFEILTNIRAVGGKEFESYYPLIGDIENEYLKIISVAINKATCFELQLPLNVNPADTTKTILYD